MALGVCLANVLTAALCAALSVPLVRGRVKMNPLYGVRFTRSFESDALWYRINAYGGRRMIQWSVVIAALGIGALFVRDERALTALAFAPTLYVIPAFDAWRYSKRA